MPKVIDFGIAKSTSSRLVERTIFTEFKQMIGTPEYMSPEQAGESSEDIDTRIDVYSAGVLLYELITGATPFDSRRLRSAAFGELQRIIREEDPPKPSTKLTRHPETLHAVANARATPPGRLRGLVRGDLDWVVMKALEKDRARRYDSAGSMCRDIQRYLSGDAVQAAPPSAAYRARKFIRRNRGPVLAGSLLAVALVVGFAGTSWGLFNAQRQRKVAILERDRADINATRARAAEDVAIHSAYSANLMSASAAVNAVQFNLARAFLDAAPERLRGWEWRLLNARIGASIRALPPTAQFPLLKHPHPASGMYADADGRSFLTWHEGVVQRWDTQTGRLLRVIAPRAGDAAGGQLAPTASAVSADGRLLSIASAVPGSVPPVVRTATWDLHTGEQLRDADVTLPALLNGSVSISADGAWLHPVTPEHIRLTDAASSRTVAQMQIKHPFGYQNVSPDGRRSARSDLQDVIHVIDARSLEELKTLPGHTGTVISMSFSQDNRWLGSAADDDTARVWDLNASTPASMVLRHNYRVESICFSPDATLVATISKDRAVRIWDRATGTLRRTYPCESPLDPALMFMHDGRTVAALDSGGFLRF